MSILTALEQAEATITGAGCRDRAASKCATRNDRDFAAQFGCQPDAHSYPQVCPTRTCAETMNDIVERLRVPVMFHGADANGRPEQTNAERREAASEIAYLRERMELLLNLEQAYIGLLRQSSEEIERLRADRLKLDWRIHNQRKALRENWEIVEQRGNWVLARFLSHEGVTLD